MEKITELYPTWKPNDVASIKSLDWTVQELVVVFLCQLRSGVKAWPDISKDFFEISITFENVSGLQLKFGEPNFQQIMGFDIMDLSANGWEEVNFKIVDYEYGIIQFYCQKIQVNEVSKPAKIDSFMPPFE